ncbi:type II TA system antitoxin MqsA family protein [Cupriavidus taiwanensis]|uniref:type II TA system antitoxin MqsA family protein n=1 Tax=Cupriavidus taiwanensis TaxID=164546 RepID=UPI000E108FB8|nr:type II TA system antitoxin MqsA family protein [Cupriavidus taiwanensis]SOY51337.1 putative DNA-binding transcriptional regulator [Cupriavidus taiwanensis]SOY54036.1 putative DNA-binding transcriptional regulator [Cupriavidus taiwanensis]SOY84093.1 putative DNA-binding transcriptional regulator [Cupriavidus taiwanensis]SOZ58682.1 putative DNA-binding transcriptional regulator [Cupriavidus taiwanensis]SOZ81228.1 putative DNA-binding transcriptional regulator [Cupriavidus taiwanensis]
MATVIEQVRGEFCSACGQYLTDFEKSDRVMKRMNAFNREVNAAFVDPAYIVSVRKKLRLDQREAGEIFGGGVNSFSRYETGKTKPPLALIKLLKLLDHHPELLAEVRAA